MKTPEEKRAWQREYYRKNRARLLAYSRAYRRANRERLNRKRREKYYFNPEFRAYEINRHTGKPLTAEIRPASHADKQTDTRKGKRHAI